MSCVWIKSNLVMWYNYDHIRVWIITILCIFLHGIYKLGISGGLGWGEVFVYMHAVVYIHIWECRCETYKTRHRAGADARSVWHSVLVCQSSLALQYRLDPSLQGYVQYRMTDLLIAELALEKSLMSSDATSLGAQILHTLSTKTGVCSVWVSQLLCLRLLFLQPLSVSWW